MAARDNASATPPNKDAAADLEAQAMTPGEIVAYILECRREAFEARKTRMKRNSINRDAFMGIQDWSGKSSGQSQEFLPKTASAVEQFAAYVKRAMTQFGDWFSVELQDNVPPFLTDAQIRNLLSVYLKRIPDGDEFKPIETVLADAVKSATLDSLILLKVHGKYCKHNTYSVDVPTEMLNIETGKYEAGEPSLMTDEKEVWRLCVDDMRAEDWFPDPKGRGLYKIHEVEKDYYNVLEMAEAGIYDLDIVRAISEDFKKEQGSVNQRYEAQRGQNYVTPPSFRRQIVITEFWGTIINRDGRIVYRNCLAAIANKKYLIRPPEPNPFWHQQSPFVDGALIRVPQSVWHKALMDSASELNFAMNEMFNLMLDGGISAVWGIKQLRGNYLDNPSQVSNGIPQGATLVVNEDLPASEKVLEVVSQGQIPSDAMAIFEMLNREFTQAALTNDIKLGSLPPRQVKATEIIQSDQSQAVTLDSITSDLERIIESMLYKSWLTLLQHMDDLPEEELVGAVGQQAAVLLRLISPAERFAIFGNYCNFKVFGLSATLSRVRDFQKTMALMQMVSQNPIMLQAFMQNYSIQRVIKLAMKQLSINPDDIAMTMDEKAQMPQIIQQIMMFSQMMGGGGGQAQPGALSAPTGGNALGGPAGENGGMSPVMGGDAQLPAEINQAGNPLTGMSM